MKKIITLFALLIQLAALAQTDSTGMKAQFKLSLNYNTGLNYYGRTDSLKSTGFFPMAELWLGKGLYINAAPIFVNNHLQSFDYAGTVATIGYQFNTNPKWFGNMYFLKPFYKQNSTLVQSTLQEQAGGSISYLNKILNLNIGGDIKYSDQLDFGANAGVDHLFRLQNADNSVWVLDPSFYTYAGTQNLTNTYYKKTGGTILTPPLQQQVTENVQQFNILAYEVSMPVIYAKSKWQFIATPAYIMPESLITIPGHPEQSERGDKMFYATLTAKYLF
jgi:hypothetical protein